MRGSKVCAGTLFHCASLTLALTSGGALADLTSHASARSPDSENCTPFENTRPLCVFPNPEDLAVLANENTLIVSEYGDHHGTLPGALVFYNLDTERRRIAYDGHKSGRSKEYWGETSCTEPPGELFSPHGIDLRQRPDSRWQLLAVQHGGRESVEFFEVAGKGNTLELIWRGCAIAPPDASLNAVAAGPDGDFYTTKMMSRNASWTSEDGAATQATGLVYHWSSTQGFQPVPNSEGLMLNGIAASEDGNTLYVVYSGENRIKKLDPKTGAIHGIALVRAVDNLKWAEDGQTLLAASFIGEEGSEAFAACSFSTVGICPIAFEIVELNPDSLATSTLFSNPRAPMGAATVGLKFNADLFIGSFSGNRLLQVNLAERHE